MAIVPAASPVLTPKSPPKAPYRRTSKKRRPKPLRLREWKRVRMASPEPSISNVREEEVPEKSPLPGPGQPTQTGSTSRSLSPSQHNTVELRDESAAINGGLFDRAVRAHLRLLPTLLRLRPDVRATLNKVYDSNFLSLELDPGFSPKLRSRATVSVFRTTALDVGIGLTRKNAKGSKGRSHSTAVPSPPSVAILNVASDGASCQTSPLRGKLDTEADDLSFRTSLPLSFPEARPGATSTRRQQPTQKNAHRPKLDPNQALFSPQVLVVRTKKEGSYGLIGASSPTGDSSNGNAGSWPTLPVISVITVEASPGNQTQSGAQEQGHTASNAFLNTDRRTRRRLMGSYTVGDGHGSQMVMSTKNRMRLVLRIAASNGYRSLVLGCMGGTQAALDAMLWAQVLKEPEFAGRGWWRDVCFAVSDQWHGDGMHALYKSTLAGIRL